MQRGIIGCGSGAFKRIEPVRKACFRDSEELIDQVDVTGVRRTPDGLDINQGVAATQTIDVAKSVSLDGDSISVRDERTIATRHTNFLAVPGEFVVVDSKRGRFLFELLSDELEVDISTATVNLDELLATHTDASAWKVGYFDRDDPSQNGVAHGQSILAAAEYADRLAGTEKNQLGLHLSYDGREYKLFVTRSGYLDIYQPRDLDPVEFAEFIQNVVLPNVST